MGTTRTWYCIRFHEETEKELQKNLRSFSERYEDTIFCYKPELSWISLYHPHFCDGCAYIDEKFLCQISEEFGSEILGMSVFDSDIALLIYCENGTMYRYACTDEDTQEEFGLEKYSLDPPYPLCRYGMSEKLLETIWDREEYVFAEDIFAELSKVMNFCLFDGHDFENLI